MIDCPRGSLSMQTLRKLPTNKPSKAKININIRDNPDHPTKPESITGMIHQGSELSNGGGVRIVWLAIPVISHQLTQDNIEALSDGVFSNIQI